MCDVPSGSVARVKVTEMGRLPPTVTAKAALVSGLGPTVVVMVPLARMLPAAGSMAQAAVSASDTVIAWQ